jgi:hypothetical protein
VDAGDEYRTFPVIEALPLEMLIIRIPVGIMGLCGYDGTCSEGRTPLPTLANKLNASVFGFSPDVVFSVDSTAKRAGAINGVPAGTGVIQLPASVPL